MKTASPDIRVPPRVLAPDLARGFMLLLIALANVPWHLYGHQTEGFTARIAGGGILDWVWQAIAFMAIDGRSYPLFAFLFGYGIWQLYRRQIDAGADAEQVHRLLRRRHLWMLVFGFLHALLLWGGDIIGAYGLVGLLVCWLFLDRSDKTLAVWASVLSGILVVASVGAILAGMLLQSDGQSEDSLELPSAAEVGWYPSSILPRLAMWLGVTLGQGLLSLAVPAAVLFAILAARHHVLEKPHQHRKLLIGTAVAGVGLAWSGGALAFAHFAGAFPELPSWTFQVLTIATGLAGGLAYAAVFGLVAMFLGHRELGRVGRAIRAVGQRSMTSYIVQSILFVPVLAAWGLGVGAVISEWQGAVYAVAVWLMTVLIAVWMERRGWRGPFERLLRHLTYPRSSRQVSASRRS